MRKKKLKLLAIFRPFSSNFIFEKKFSIKKNDKTKTTRYEIERKRKEEKSAIDHL